MERFTLKIIDKPKSSLRNACRLCGMDNPEKINILRDEDVFCDDDVPLATKINVCCGIEVAKKDRMPQKICSLCCDKINDFYEFREMCTATQVQTRDLLGLPREMPKPKSQPPPPSAPNPAPNVKTPSQTILEPPIITESRTRVERRMPEKRPPKDKKKKKKVTIVTPPEIKSEPDPKQTPGDVAPAPAPAPAVKKVKPKVKQKLKKKVQFAVKQKAFQKPAPKRPIVNDTEPKPKAKKARVEKVAKVVKVAKTPPMVTCPICKDSMEKDIYNVHMFQLHTPKTYEFGCSPCGVPFESKNDYNVHMVWHKNCNIPFRCFKCQGSFDRLSSYTIHAMKSCPAKHVFTNTVPNTQCTICGMDFATFNLYNWHGCFIKANSNCPKCNKFIRTKQNMFKHIFSCVGKGDFPPAPSQEEPEEEAPPPPPVSAPEVVKKVKPLKIKILDRKKYSSAVVAPVQKVIKTEPDSTLEIEESQVNVEAPSLHTTLDDIRPPEDGTEQPENMKVKKKKTLMNPYASLIRKIKQEPKDPKDTTTTLPAAKIVPEKLPENKKPEAPRPTVRVKQEPIDTGYEQMVNLAAKNIKKERIDPADEPPAPEIPPEPVQEETQGELQEPVQEESTEPTEPAQEEPPAQPTMLPRGIRIKQEVIVKPEPVDPAYDRYLPQKPIQKPVQKPLAKVAKKRVFKIPSALIKKIQQERSIREQEKSQSEPENTQNNHTEAENNDEAPQNSVPVITGVRSIEKSDFGSTSEPFYPVRIKSERISPPRTLPRVQENVAHEENGVNENGNHADEPGDQIGQEEVPPEEPTVAENTEEMAVDHVTEEIPVQKTVENTDNPPLENLPEEAAQENVPESASVVNNEHNGDANEHSRSTDQPEDGQK
uniref:Uncharacterized protein n=1 Tax=Phlebotomus papatasi TaxID=29031 RepID=A0A1B0D5M4_PHLPP